LEQRSGILDSDSGVANDNQCPNSQQICSRHIPPLTADSIGLRDHNPAIHGFARDDALACAVVLIH
jgi:hypothetical protein